MAALAPPPSPAEEAALLAWVSTFCPTPPEGSLASVDGLILSCVAQDTIATFDFDAAPPGLVGLLRSLEHAFGVRGAARSDGARATPLTDPLTIPTHTPFLQRTWPDLDAALAEPTLAPAALARLVALLLAWSVQSSKRDEYIGHILGLPEGHQDALMGLIQGVQEEGGGEGSGEGTTEANTAPAAAVAATPLSAAPKPRAGGSRCV